LQYALGYRRVFRLPFSSWVAFLTLFFILFIYVFCCYINILRGDTTQLLLMKEV